MTSFKPKDVAIGTYHFFKDCLGLARVITSDKVFCGTLEERTREQTGILQGIKDYFSMKDHQIRTEAYLKFRVRPYQVKDSE